MFSGLYACSYNGCNSAFRPGKKFVGHHGRGGGADRCYVGSIHYAADRPGIRIEEIDDGKMIGQAEFQVPVEYVDDLDAYLHPRLPGCHGQREPFARDLDLRPGRTLDLATRERSKTLLQFNQEFRRVEQVGDLLLVQSQDLLPALANFKSGAVWSSIGGGHVRHPIVRQASIFAIFPT